MAELTAVFAGALFSLLGALVLLSAAWRLTSGLRSWCVSALAERAEADEPDEEAAPLLGDGGPRTARHYVYCCLQGKNKTGRVLRVVLLALIVASVGCYVLSTRLNISDFERRLIDVVETVTVVIFTVEFALRFWVCTEGMPGGAGRCSRLAWLASDFYAMMDLASLVPFYLDLLTPSAFPVNLRLIRALRAMELLEDAGAGVETFAKILMSKSQVLGASSFFGASVWLVCSAMYYYFDQGNPAMVLCPLCSDPGDPGSCKGEEQHDSCHGRMDSIPSSMYFCLVNLFGEFPLMMEHSVGGKCVGVFIAIVGNAMAGIAMGVIGNGFADYVKEQKGAKESLDQAAEGNYSKLPAGPAVGRRRSSSSDLTPCQRLLMALDRPRGLWAKVCCGLALAGWMEVLLKGHVEASGASGADPSTLGDALQLGSWGKAAILLYAPFEATSAVLLGAEYAIRVAAERRAWGPCAAYVSSGLGLVDLLAFAPVLLQQVAPDSWACWIWPLICFARTLKLERYMCAFGALRRVIADSAPILTTTGVVAVVLLLLFSSLMWLAEFSNPLEEVRGYYESIPKAMWMTMLNLSGECPLADYTILGKLVTGFIGVFAVSIFSIPFGLMSDGFQDYLDDDGSEDEGAAGEEGDEELRAKLQEQLAVAAQRRLPGPAAAAQLLQGSSNPECSARAANFEKASITMIFASVALTLLESGTGFAADEAEQVPLWLQAAELFVVFWFTFELLLRFYAAPADPQYLSRRRYMLSFCGVIDMLSVAPYYLSKFAGSESLLGELGSVADLHDEEFRLCRLLRLLQLSNYVPSLGLIMRVLQDPGIQQDLLVALYVAATCWLFFATLLHLAQASDGEHPEMAWRFRSVLSSMPFTLIHLTGDYPLVDYTVLARFVHVVMLVAAQGLVGVAGGIIASGFTRELQALRARDRERRRNAVKVLGRCVRYWLYRRRWMKLVQAVKEQAQREKQFANKAAERSSFMYKVMRFVHSGPCICARVALIISSVIGVLAGSVSNIRDVVGPAAFDYFEQGCFLLFTLDYLAKLYCAPVMADYVFRRDQYAFSFFGVVDVITIVPYWLHLALCFGGWQGDFALVRAVQSLRVLQLEEYVQAFTLLDDAWAMCKDTVMTSALIAFMVWLFGAVLFFELEQGNEALEGAMDSIPSALHFTAIFLGGEWAVVDFTPMGKVLCVFYCLMGIAVFAIPVGSFFEAFEAAITGDDEE